MNLKNWVKDKQENGDDGSGYADFDEYIAAKADTINGNLEQLLKLAGEVADPGLGIELHRLYIDLSEAIADLASKCDCDKCDCVNVDDYTRDGGTCEDCFRDCVEVEA